MVKDNKLDGLLSRLYKEYIIPGKLLLIVFVVIIGIILSSIQSFIPYYLRGIIDFAERKDMHGFLLDIEIFGILLLLFMAILYFYGYYLEWIKVKVKEKIRQDVLLKLHSISYKDVISNSQGSYLQRIIDDVDKIGPLILDAYMQLGIHTLTALISLVIMLKLSWQLTIAGIIVLPAYLYLTYIYQKKAVPLTYKKQNDYQKVIAFTDESLKSTYTIRNQGAVSRIMKKFKEIYAQYVKSYLNLFKVNYFYSDVLNAFLAVLSQFILIGFGAYLIIKGRITAGTVVGFIAYSNYLMQPLNYILVFSTKVEPSKVSLDRVYTILGKPSVYEVREISQADNVDVNRETAIGIKNLTFKYDNNSILDNLNFKIKKGEWVCIVGESGSGKSTLLNILLKHFPVPDNTVFIFGKDINKYTAEEILGLITLIEQEPQLFSEMSIMENLTIGVDRSAEEIKEVAKKLGMGDILEKISTERKVLLSNAGLSGGEKKRLSILRGLLRKTPIVILDEPTAFVDKGSGIAILESLKNSLRDRTVIITTHDKEVLSFCDGIIDLQKMKNQEQKGGVK